MGQPSGIHNCQGRSGSASHDCRCHELLLSALHTSDDTHVQAVQCACCTRMQSHAPCRHMPTHSPSLVAVQSLLATTAGPLHPHGTCGNKPLW